MFARREEGFTLVEVVIAVIMLAMLTVGVVRIYNSNIFAIVLSGDKTKHVYEVQQELEKLIAEDNAHGNDSLFIPFPNYPGFYVMGEEVEKTSSGEEANVTATVFIPKR